MALRRSTKFRMLTYLASKHTTPMRAVFAVAGFGAMLLLTARVVLARDTARLFWQDDFKIGMHRVDWCLYYGWLHNVLRRKPAFDMTYQMPDAGLDAVDAILAKRSLPADLRAKLYVASARANRAGNATGRATHLATYCRIATLLAAQMPPPNEITGKTAPAFTQPQAYATLRDARDLMQALNMPWYIVSGTFLGAVREGDFLAHDYDVDIGVNIEDFDHDQFLDGLRANDQFCLVRVDDYVDLEGADLTPVCARALYKIMHHTGVEVDVFIHHLKGGQRWHGSARHRWWNVNFDLAPYTIADLDVPGPANADVYLRENYGEWRVPQTVFSCSTGTPNVSFNRNLVSIAQFMINAHRGSATAQNVLTAEGYLQNGRFTLPWA